MKTKTLVTTFLTIVLISCASANIPIPTETPIQISTPTPSFTTVPPTLTPSATHTATLTSSPTPSATHTATATSTPYPTNTPSPTATPIPVFSLIRPVSDDVPLYHAYGVPVGGDRNGHNGYDFGLDSCADLKYAFNATAVGSGKVIVTGGDGDIWIDLGVGRLTDGSVIRLLASYWHGKPLPGIAIGSIVKQGQDVYQSIPCGVNNHPAELELQLVALPANAPRDANAVMDLARKLYKNGEFTHIDPALAGINPK